MKTRSAPVAIWVSLALLGSCAQVSDSPNTPGPPGVSTVLVLGDWGSGTKEMTRVAQQMQRYAGERGIEAILTTGDNLYIDDYESVLMAFEWATSSGIDFWITWGNHDVASPGRIEAVHEAFDTPAKWGLIAWESVDILILDSNQVQSTEQRSFLESTLQQSRRPTIVALHHPPYSCSGRTDGSAVRSQWVPIFDEDVVLVLAGHDHNYQRFEIEDSAYIVTGGGGQALSPLRACPARHPETSAAAATFHFLAITQAQGQLRVEAVDVNGEVIDSTTLSIR